MLRYCKEYSPSSRTSMMVNVGSAAFTSSRIFSDKDLADSRLRVAMVVIVRAWERKGLLMDLNSLMDNQG
jgi:hypothetical protein